MSVKDALDRERFISSWSPSLRPTSKIAVKGNPCISTEVRNISWDFLSDWCGTLSPGEALGTAEGLYLCHFRGGGESRLIALLDRLLTEFPALWDTSAPRTLAAALCLDPDFSPLVPEDWPERLNGQEVLLTPRGVPWGGRRGLLRRWEAGEGPRILPVLDRNGPLPDSIAANGYPGLLPGGDREPLFALDPVGDLPELLEDYLRACTVVGQPPENRLSTFALAALKHLSSPLLLAALSPGGVLSGENFQMLQAYAKDPAQPEERRRFLAQALQILP